MGVDMTHLGDLSLLYQRGFLGRDGTLAFLGTEGVGSKLFVSLTKSPFEVEKCVPQSLSDMT